MAFPAVTRQYVCCVTMSQQKLLLLTHSSPTLPCSAAWPSLCTCERTTVVVMRRDERCHTHPIPSWLWQRASPLLPWILSSAHPADSSCCSSITPHWLETNRAASPDSRPVAPSIQQWSTHPVMWWGWMDAACICEDIISQGFFVAPVIASIHALSQSHGASPFPLPPGDFSVMCIILSSHLQTCSFPCALPPSGLDAAPAHAGRLEMTSQLLTLSQNRIRSKYEKVAMINEKTWALIFKVEELKQVR